MNEEDEVQQNNMISNLPLLFANGYPTSLDKITESQLEKFIPFMVQCSLGHINLQGNIECSEPEWWPEDLPFDVPFSKPKKFYGNWMEKLKEIVIICYQFHKSVFLLRFCSDLASYEQASLRFINNYNSTTSLFDRRNNKLLVTFRNENMSYDQPLKNRKCLMQQKSKSGHPGHEIQQTMVEPAPFDIYLCDYCDAELYSKDAILEHEKICNNDDDVILCDSPVYNDPDEDHSRVTINEDDELRIRFLMNFNLKCRREKTVQSKDLNLVSTSLQKEDIGVLTSDRKKRLPKRNRTVHSLARCPTIPLSSPAGLYLVRSTKTSVAEEYLSERLDRMERFCSTPLLSKNQVRPKYFEKKISSNSPHCTFKKPQEYSAHIYVFPRKQFSQRRRAENFLFFNSLLIKRCRPISVRLKKITDQDLKTKKPAINSNLNIKLTRDTSQSSNWKISHTCSEIIVETIDLCSSEDEEKPEFKNQGETTVLNNIIHGNFNINNQLTLQRTMSPERIAIKKAHVNNINKETTVNTIVKSTMQQSLNNNFYKSVSTTHHIENIQYLTVNQKNNNLESNSPSLKACLPEVSCTRFEGNLLVSSSALMPSESGNGLSYLIHPSISLLSTYNKSSIGETVGDALKCNMRNNLTNIEIAKKSDAPDNHILSLKNFPANKPTLPSSSTKELSSENFAPITNARISFSDNKQTYPIDQECVTRKSLPLVKKLTSPNCVVSIDLTS